MEFWTIEVLSADPLLRDPEAAPRAAWTASRWHQAHGEALVEAAITNGAKEWSWVRMIWGRVFEVGFADEADWLRFRATPAVLAALDAVPDPERGLLIYSGRGGSSSAGMPRRPCPAPVCSAAELPHPELPLYACDRTELRPEPGLLI